MIGNDVVDITAASHQSNWRRKGFLDKVFSKDEQVIIFSASDRNIMVWLLWSMKEAAYKAHQREFNLPRTLHWQRQNCTIISSDRHSASGIVKIDRQTYFTNSEVGLNVIHTSAVNQKGMMLKNALFKAASEVTKKQLLSHVGGFFFLPENELSIKKNMQGIPYITYKGEVFFSQFSLSDHGKYSAFSMSLIIS